MPSGIDFKGRVAIAVFRDLRQIVIEKPVQIAGLFELRDMPKLVSKDPPVAQRTMANQNGVAQRHAGRLAQIEAGPGGQAAKMRAIRLRQAGYAKDAHRFGSEHADLHASAACQADNGLPCASTVALKLVAHTSVACMARVGWIGFRFSGLDFIAFL
jgi:hypothetical protein